MTTANTPFPQATIEATHAWRQRELKKALEAFWSGKIDQETFESAAHSLRVDTYARLKDLGLNEDYAIPADVALYDQVLETSLTVGVVGGDAAEVSLEEEFALARGNAERAPLEMTKWFDTNYHYIVPEIADEQKFIARPQRVVRLVEEARAQGHAVRPYLVGPVTVLALSKQAEAPPVSRWLAWMSWWIPIFRFLQLLPMPVWSGYSSPNLQRSQIWLLPMMLGLPRTWRRHTPGFWRLRTARRST